MKLHLPLFLRKSLLACIVATAGLAYSIVTYTAGCGIAICMLASPLAKAETSTVTISSSGDAKLTSTPDDSLIIMNLNRGHLYGSSTLNSSFDVAADVQIDSLIISDGFKLNTYNFRGDISGSGTFERTSDAKGANQTYVFTGDMSQYSGDMKLSKANDGNSFKFIGNQSGTGAITIAAGNTIEVDGATMNNSSITSAGLFKVSGNSSFIGAVRSTGELNVSGTATFDGALTSSGILKVNSNATLGGTIYSEGSLVLGPDALLTNQGSFSFGENATINLVHAVAAEDEQRTLTYTIFSSGSTGTSNFSELSLENIIGIQPVGRDWSFNEEGSLVGVLNNHSLSYAGGNLVWNATTASFSNGSETVAFTNGDDVTFSGTSAVTLGESLSAQRLTVANGAEVTISGEGSGALSLAEAVVNGTLKLNKGGQNGAFSGNVDVYGTLSVETGDVTGWSGSDGIKSIDILSGGEMYVAVTNNQTGAGLAINLQGGSISGVSGSNLDLGYGGAVYGYSSLSALAADTATAENPTVSTISGTNLTLRQNHTTISVAENARLDISSGILVKGNKSDLNGEGAVPSHLQAGLVKTGAGELRLSGANTYTQATTVAEGTLTLTGGASMASASISVNDGAFFHLTTESGLSASVSGVLSGNGTLRKTGLGSASIGGLSDSFAGHIDLQQGTLSVGSPVVISSGRELSLGMTGAVLNSNLSLGDGRLSIDYSGSGAATSLNNSALTLLGGTQLQLSNLTGGDGKAYELFAGIGSLLGRDGNALVLDDTNNAISNYFDASQPGTGFWADGTLQLTNAGTLQLVLHDETVKAAQTITARQTNPSAYQYYAGIAFEDISYVSDSWANGGAIYGVSYSTITLSDNGCVVFSGNTASAGSSYANGGAIYGDGNSTITLSNNGSVTFRGNSVSGAYSAYGGAIYGYGNSTITLSNNGSVVFEGNTASSSSYSANGGAIYGDGNSTITLSNNGSVTFSGNSVSNLSRANGGAIYGDNSGIALSNNGSVTFSGNTASAGSSYANGGAIYGDEDSTISLSNNGSVVFEGNTASSSSYSAYGGAICGSVTMVGNGDVAFNGNAVETASGYARGGAIVGDVTMVGNGDVAFSGNAASGSKSYGGAIYGEPSSTIELSNNGSVVFEGNTASSSGGAIYGVSSSTIMLSNNGSVTFSGNTASSGGAIYGHGKSTITLSNNGSVVFEGNTASSSGGAIYYGYGNSTITLSNNGSVVFEGNAASSSGGAVYGDVTMEGNGDVTFSGNAASSYGGAVYGDVTMEGNGDVTFSGNAASSSGGAIDGSVTMTGNGDVTFSGNAASSSGGAVYGDVTMEGNGDVTFSGNAASGSSSANGGAIYTYGNLNIRNNDSVEFYQNAEVRDGSYRLRSIYAGGSEDIISFSAAEGKNITFRDSIYIASGSTFNLNETCGEIEQKGDIIFTGATTEADLLAMKGSAGTAAEILASRTSEVYALTNLYGGRLCVEDGAVYKGRGITAMEGSEATVRVKDATLAHGGYDLNFNSGTSLELEGNTRIIGNVQMLEGSSLSLIVPGALNVTEWSGQLNLAGSMTINMGGDSTWTGENRILVYLDGGISGWKTDKFSVTGSQIYGKEDVSWVDNLLVLNYNAETFNRYYNGSATYTSKLSNAILHHFSELRFEDIIGDSKGGAIVDYAGVRDNGKVVFCGNKTITSASDYYTGSAIYASNGLSIQNNDSVEFYQNAVLQGEYVRLKSIYAKGGDVNLAASKGKNILFRDSIYLGSACNLNLNRGAGDKLYEGDIIFTGATTEADILAVKGSAGTELEISESRRSVVNTMTNLYGGRLLVVEGAEYMGCGITAHEGSSATVRVQNASLHHAGYDLTFHSGTMLELMGNNTIMGDVQMQEGSTLMLNATDSLGVSSLAGNLNLSGEMILAMGGNVNPHENSILLYVSGDVEGWNEDRFTISDGGAQSGVSSTWVDNLLVLNYNAATFDPFFNKTVTYTSQQAPTLYHHYEDIHFTNVIGATSSGGYYDDNGAIHGSNVILYHNGSVSFTKNEAGGYGGGIYGTNIELAHNETVTFNENSALNGNGGAIYGIPGSSVRIHHNDKVEFSKNTAARSGGAIGLNSTYTGRIELSHNGSVEFCENEANSGGGALSGGTIILSNNECLKFNENNSGSAGGAIQGNSVTLSHNGSVTFSENVANGTGGAIQGNSIKLDNNDNVSFIGNSATTRSSGAIDGTNIIITNNDSVTFLQNSAAYNGGAITARTLYLCDNHSVVFNENSAVNGGGAIYASNGLNIQNNDSVEFYQNALVNNGVYQLRSITVNGGPVNMSAAAGKSIEFRDSIYLGTGNTLSLNADYTDAEEKVHEQQGDIIFTGKTTVNDLYIVKGNVDGTEEEIQASRISEVHGAVNLYGGRLRVEEQAVLKTTAGLAVAEDSNATVKIHNAELDAGTCDIAIGATGRLELSNGAILRANEIIIDDEATLALSCSDLQTRATFTLREAVAAGGTAYNTGKTVVIDGDLTLNGGATLMADNAHFCMTEGSVLTINASDEKKINLVLTLGTVYEPDVPITLFSDIENLRFIYNGTELTDSATVNPGDFFTGAWINDSTSFTYDAEAGTFFVMNVNSLPIPEPSTTTLGLLALAGLAARRRRLD